MKGRLGRRIAVRTNWNLGSLPRANQEASDRNKGREKVLKGGVFERMLSSRPTRSLILGLRSLSIDVSECSQVRQLGGL